MQLPVGNWGDFCTLLVGFATPPVLLATLGSRVITQSINDIGQFSEQIFQGDRLPILHFPIDPPRQS